MVGDSLLKDLPKPFKAVELAPTPLGGPRNCRRSKRLFRRLVQRGGAGVSRDDLSVIDDGSYVLEDSLSFAKAHSLS